MPISPNTNFTSGQVLTAQQQNQFPRGVVAFGSNTTATMAFSAETLSVTSSSFTAVANRYYKVTYNEPAIGYNLGTVVYVDLKIRLTNISGTELQVQPMYMNSSLRNNTTCSIVRTFTAGSTVVVGTIAPGGGGTVNALRSATATAFIVVEDLGPA